MALTIHQPSVIFNRMLFHTKCQEENESVTDFATNLQILLRECQYPVDCIFLDGLARDRFIAGIEDKELQAFLTTQPEGITLNEIVEICLNLQSPLLKVQNPEIVQRCSRKNVSEGKSGLPTFSNKTNVLDIQIANETRDKAYCDKEPFNEENENGKQLLENENTHKCCYCNDQTNASSLVQLPIPKHVDTRLFQCEKCDFSTSWKCSLTKHLEKVHNSATINSQYICDKCGFSTKFSRAYKKHLMSLKISGKCEIPDQNQNSNHSKQNEPIKCPHCSYTRTQRSKVLNHIKSVHEDEKPFKCSECKSSFKLKFRLTAHMKLSHGDGKKFQCQFCSHMTAHKKRLEEHIKAIHNKEKNFACHMCNFSTSWSGTLSKHMWVVHQEGTGNTFTCESCGYSTRDKKLYKNHLMNLHNIGDYKPGLCTICGKTFKTRDYLRDHVFKVHKKKLKDLASEATTSKDAITAVS